MKIVPHVLALLLSMSAFAVDEIPHPEDPRVAEVPTFHCVGTEPFWNMNVSGRDGLIRFRTPESSLALAILGRRVAIGSRYNGSFIVDTKYTKLIVSSAECNDGMSDNIYTHTAVFDMGGRNVYYGCCDIDFRD